MISFLREDDKTSYKGVFLGMERYNLTKMLDVFLAQKIATLPAAEGIRVSSVDPGFCVSEFRVEIPWPWYLRPVIGYVDS